MLLFQTLLTVAYVVVVGRVWMLRRRGPQGPAVRLPAADLPPDTAVGLPPSGEQFGPYVEDGIAALDAYLSEGFAA